MNLEKESLVEQLQELPSFDATTEQGDTMWNSFGME